MISQTTRCYCATIRLETTSDITQPTTTFRTLTGPNCPPDTPKLLTASPANAAVQRFGPACTRLPSYFTSCSFSSGPSADKKPGADEFHNWVWGHPLQPSTRHGVERVGIPRATRLALNSLSSEPRVGPRASCRWTAPSSSEPSATILRMPKSGELGTSSRRLPRVTTAVRQNRSSPCSTTGCCSRTSPTGRTDREGDGDLLRRAHCRPLQHVGDRRFLTAWG